MSDLTGQTIRHYELHDCIGEGASGSVFRGTDTHIGEPVAIKHLKPRRTSTSAIQLERFQREGELLREMDHPNIVKLLDTFEEDNQYFIVMEYMPGGSLRDLLSQQPQLPLEQLLWIALDLADALTRAHRLDIIHRDLKPANVLMANDGTPRLTDFGIAHLIGQERFTGAGHVTGTPRYLSPEAINGQPVDARADIWSFGILLFEMLTGYVPFEAELMTQLFHAILHDPVPDLEASRPDAPIALVDLVYRMLEKDPCARIPSVRIVGTELEALLRTENLVESVLGEDVDRHTFDGSSVFATPTPATDAPLHNLPVQKTEFVGREDELAEIARLLAEPNVRLVTILGPGGMGKTRLALEAVEQQVAAFERGVWFVPLTKLGDPAGIVSAIAEAAGLQLGGGIASGLQRSSTVDEKQQLLNYLRAKEMLLVLDNFEHLLDGAALVTDILHIAPRVKVLTTSRERLNLSGETLYALVGMTFPDWETPEDALDYAAVKLFMSSARRVDPGFELSAEDLRYVARICRLVEGMPLGILLAAAWIDMFSPHEIADEITHSLDFLKTELRDVPERHRSMRAVFESAWGRLGDDERTTFMKLAVFRGGFTRRAAQHVADTHLRMLTGLVNKSLLRRDPATGRYEIHELLRQYAEEQLEWARDAETVRDAHSAYYLEALAEREADLKGARMVEALDDIEADWENVRAAWLHGVVRDDVTCLQAGVISFRMFGESRKTPHEIFGLVDPAVQALERAAPTTAHDVLLGSLLLDWKPPEQTEGETLERLNRAVRLLRQHNVSGPLVWALSNLGFVLARDGAHDEGDTYLREAVALARASGAPFELARALARRGNALVQFLPEVRDEAEQYLLETQEIVHTLGNPFLLNTARFGLGALAFRRGDWAEVVRIYEAVARNDRAMGYKLGLAGTVIRLGWAAYRQGDSQRAVDLLEDSLTQYLDFTGDGREPLARLCFAYQATGDYAAARDAIVRTLQGYWFEQRFTGYVLPTLVAAGFLRAAEGQPEAAVELLACTLTNPGCFWEFHVLAEPYLADLQAQLSPDVYAAAWARGEALDLDATMRALVDELSATPGVAEAGAVPYAVDTSPDALSERELEVLALMAEGLTNPQIADELFISPGTVKAHAHNIYEKLGVNNRMQAVARAQELGLLS